MSPQMSTDLKFFKAAQTTGFQATKKIKSAKKDIHEIKRFMKDEMKANPMLAAMLGKR